MPVAQSQELIEVFILVTLKMEFSSILTGNATHSSTIFFFPIAIAMNSTKVQNPRRYGGAHSA